MVVLLIIWTQIRIQKSSTLNQNMSYWSVELEIREDVVLDPDSPPLPSNSSPWPFIWSINSFENQKPFNITIKPAQVALMACLCSSLLPDKFSTQLFCQGEEGGILCKCWSSERHLLVELGVSWIERLRVCDWYCTVANHNHLEGDFSNLFIESNLQAVVTSFLRDSVLGGGSGGGTSSSLSESLAWFTIGLDWIGLWWGNLELLWFGA